MTDLRIVFCRSRSFPVRDGCPRCGRWRAVPHTTCELAVCRACGAAQCHSNGAGHGECAVCYVGLLEGWSGCSKPCQRAGCSAPGVAAVRRRRLSRPSSRPPPSLRGGGARTLVGERFARACNGLAELASADETAIAPGDWPMTRVRLGDLWGPDRPPRAIPALAEIEAAALARLLDRRTSP